MVTAVMWNLHQSSDSSRTIDVDLDAKARDVIQLMTTLTGAKSPLGAFFLGQRIAADTQLKDVQGLRAHHRIYVMQVADDASSTMMRRPPMSMREIDVLRANWHDAFMHHRDLLLKMTANKESMTSLIASTPGLRADSLAPLLQDPLLLLTWLADKNIHKLANEHPSVIDACQQMTSALHTEVARAPPMYDDNNDESDEESGDEQQGPRPRQRQQPQMMQQRAAPPLFNRERLEAALAAVGGNRPAAPVNAPPPPGQGAAGLFTTEMLQRIMNATATAAAAAPPPPPANNFAPEMEQMEAMGFVNVDENMRALRESGGNVQLALEYIINEREAQMPLD